MKYSNQSVMKNQTYYILVVFKDKTKMGEHYPNEYKRYKCAAHKFNELRNSGLYQSVILRKEEVFLRTPTQEISSSTVVREITR